jgi:hypothetical protein
MLPRLVGKDLEFGVRVAPGASRSRVVGRYGDRLKVQVVASAERGKANRAARELLAAAFDVALSAVEIVHGSTSQDKVIRIHGLGVDGTARLLALLGEPAEE